MSAGQPRWFRRALLPGVDGPAAVLVHDGVVDWIGPDHDADRIGATEGGIDGVIDLGGALVLPGFTDAHVHVTETGLLLAGLDLSGCRSVPQVLDLVAAAAGRGPGEAVLGHGWDELLLAEGRAPTAAELDRAGGGAEVYLSRIDVHSAVVSGELADRAGLIGLPGWEPTGRVERDAHHAARHATRYGLEPARRRALHELALGAAAAAGLTELHEMSAPHIAPDDDLGALMAPATGTGTCTGSEGGRPRVVAYRGELVGDEAGARAVVARLAGAGVSRLAGLAGDLMADGSLGSRTAALRADYADEPGHRGHLYLDADQVRDHVIACTRTGLQAGFHVIGDAAVDTVLDGFVAAAGVLGEPVVRAGGHRLEHFESPDAGGVALAARLGLVAGVQPAFDAAWGGTDGMYAVRLGRGRAVALNPLADLLSAGVRLAFGSDSPVTPFAPWESIRAAIRHRTPSQRIGLRPALAAQIDATSGGGPHHRLAAGAPATFAAWQSPAIAAAAGGGGGGGGGGGADLLSALTDELTAGDPVPQCRLTVVAGRIAFSAHQG